MSVVVQNVTKRFTSRGTPAAADGAPMTVEMPRNEVEILGISEGDLVMANLREAKMFVEDHSI